MHWSAKASPTSPTSWGECSTCQTLVHPTVVPDLPRSALSVWLCDWLPYTVWLTLLLGQSRGPGSPDWCPSGGATHLGTQTMPWAHLHPEAWTNPKLLWCPTRNTCSLAVPSSLQPTTSDTSTITCACTAAGPVISCPVKSKTVWISLSCFWLSFCTFNLYYQLPWATYVLFIIIITYLQILPVHALVFPSHISVFLRMWSEPESVFSHSLVIYGFLVFPDSFLRILFSGMPRC